MTNPFADLTAAQRQQIRDAHATAKEDAARRLVRRAYEADSDSEFDVEAGLADVVRRADADPTRDPDTARPARPPVGERAGTCKQR